MNTKRHLLILLLASILLAQGLATQTTKEIPTQDPDKVDIDPELESKFQQDTDRLFSTQKTETVEIIVDLGSYRRGVSDISNMKELNEEDLLVNGSTELEEIDFDAYNQQEENSFLK